VTRSSGEHRRALLPLFLAAPLIFSGCAGSLFKTKVAPPTLYLLAVVPPADAAAAGAASAPAAELKADLAVLKPRVRAGLDNDRIAVLYRDRRLDYFADARWSGPLDEVVQDLVVQLFHSRAGLRNVSGDASAFASAYWLEIEVADFQAEYAGAAQAAGGPADGGAPPNVHVHLLARIGSSADRRIIARFEADARQPATANRLGAIVDAYNRAANQALMQIAASCAMALAPETKGP
jgi:cholesterol transport system auxiliary component